MARCFVWFVCFVAQLEPNRAGVASRTEKANAGYELPSTSGAVMA